MLFVSGIRMNWIVFWPVWTDKSMTPFDQSMPTHKLNRLSTQILKCLLIQHLTSSPCQYLQHFAQKMSRNENVIKCSWISRVLPSHWRIHTVSPARRQDCSAGDRRCRSARPTPPSPPRRNRRRWPGWHIARQSRGGNKDPGDLVQNWLELRFFARGEWGFNHKALRDQMISPFWSRKWVKHWVPLCCSDQLKLGTLFSTIPRPTPLWNPTFAMLIPSPVHIKQPPETMVDGMILSSVLRLGIQNHPFRITLKVASQIGFLDTLWCHQT